MSMAIGPRHRREGARHFYWQRATAITNIALVALMVVLLVSLAGASHETARATVAWPVIGIPLALLAIGGVWHMRLGMQVIIEDYLQGVTRTVLLLLNRFFTILVVALVVFSLVKLMTGAW
jgi:succinate dehydrogenase / fumarate reductase membrane anchor subunit